MKAENKALKENSLMIEKSNAFYQREIKRYKGLAEEYEKKPYVKANVDID